MPHAPFARSRVSWWPYVLGAVVVVMLFLLLAGLSVRQARFHARERSETSAQNLAHLIETQLAQSLDTIDLNLELAGQQIQDAHSRGANLALAAKQAQISWALREGRSRLPGQVRVLDAAGRSLQPEGQPVLSPSWAKSLAASSRLEIGAPGSDALAEPARAQGQLFLARAVHGVQGEVVALLLVSVPLSALGRFFEGLELGPQGAATLRTSDLALVYRSAAGAGTPAVPGSRVVSAALREAIASDPLEGHYMATVPIDKIERSNAYCKVGQYPLYVIIGLATDDVLGGWRTQANQTATLAAAAALITVALAVVLYRSAQRRLQSANARFEAIIQSSTDAIISKTLEGRVTSWNPGAQAIFGYTADEMIGQPLRKLLPPERSGEEEAILSRIQQGESVPPFETVRLHKDGHRFDVSITLSPLRDEDGQIVGASKIARDITHQKRMEAEVREMAFLDALTRLPNRRLLIDRLHQAQANSTRRREHAAVLFVDLDDFKQINDRHGHEVGDLILVEVSRRLRRAVRESDTVARLGGDEFVLVCEGLGGEAEAEDALVHARQLVAKVRELLAEPGPASLPACTGSVGVHLFLGTATPPEQLIRAADLSMYLDKSARHAAQAPPA